MRRTITDGTPDKNLRTCHAWHNREIFKSVLFKISAFAEFPFMNCTFLSDISNSFFFLILILNNDYYHYWILHICDNRIKHLLHIFYVLMILKSSLATTALRVAGQYWSWKYETLYQKKKKSMFCAERKKFPTKFKLSLSLIGTKYYRSLYNTFTSCAK